MTSEARTTPTRLHRLLQTLGSALCLIVAGYYAVTTILAVWHTGWTELFADQLRQYAHLLQVPFPANVFAPDNAHRQVTSNLVRLADIHWGGGDQTIGVVTGLVALTLALVMLCVRIWNDKAHGFGFRSACVLVSAVALMWMGAARMQFHGNESFQVYLVVICALIALHCVERLRLEPSMGIASVALLAAIVALLSFGTGVAVFVLLVFMMFLRRVELRWTKATALIGCGAVLAYMFLLPGSDSVRGPLSNSPLEIARNAVTWLASFWTTSWLAFGSEATEGLNLDVVSSLTLGPELLASSRAVFAATGHPSLLDLALVIGMIGLVLLAGLSFRAWRRPESVTHIEALGLGLSVFAVGVAVLVALGRTQAFAMHPLQVLADRYVQWTNLFWLGLFLAGAARWAKGPRSETASIVAALLLSAFAHPSHEYCRGWAAAVEHAVERRAAQVQAGVFASGFKPHFDMPSVEAGQKAIEVLRQNRVGMFRAPRNHLMGTVLALPQGADSVAAILGSIVRVDEEIAAPLPAWHAEGRLIDAATRSRMDGLLVADADGRIVGVGEFSFASTTRLRHRVDSVADGFDLYFRAEPPCRGLMLLGVDDEAKTLTALVPLANCSPQ